MGELYVVAEQLHGRSRALQAVEWPNFDGEPRVQAPSGFSFSDVAAENVWQNFSGLRRYQQTGEVEGQRLAESLDSVASAYEKVDAAAEEALQGGATQTSVTPESPSTPTLPPPFPIDPPQSVHSDGDSYSNPKDTEAQFSAGDQGASLMAAAESWVSKAAQLGVTAADFNKNGIAWEGSAAQAADSKFGEFKAWVDDLAVSFQLMAAQAQKLFHAHQAARAAHTPIFEEYVQLEQLWLQARMMGDLDAVVQIQQRMVALQETSEEVRARYATNSATELVPAGEVPRGVVDPIPVSANEAPGRSAGPMPGQPGGGGGGGGEVGGGGNGTGGGGVGGGALPTSTPRPETAATRAASAQPVGQQSGSPAGGGSPSGAGGAPSGGSPGGGSGGGSGGGLPGGLPGGGEPDLGGLPDLEDPALKPAAAGGGGAGAGGGGAGGGMPSTPLSPSVGAETVAPTQGGAARGGAVPAGAAGGAGGMMGGGMGPMMGQRGGGDAGEKRRDPKLAPDEDLYKEDRPWTEAVIGQRRRREPTDKKDPS